MIEISRRQALRAAVAGLAAGMARPSRPSLAAAMAGTVYSANEQDNSVSAIRRPHISSRSRSGSSTASLRRTRKVTASRPSTSRWS